MLTDLTPRLGANLDGNQKEITNTSDIKSNVHGLDIREMDGIQPFLLMDLGDMVPTNLNSVIEHLAFNQVIDYGINGLNDNTVPSADFGSIS